MLDLNKTPPKHVKPVIIYKVIESMATTYHILAELVMYSRPFLIFH